MSTPAERADARRRTWTGGVAHSFAEMDEQDLDFWLSMASVDRLRTMWSLVEDSLAFQEQRGPALRLERSTGGIRADRRSSSIRRGLKR